MVPTVWLMYSELLHLLITIILCAHSFNDTWKTVQFCLLLPKMKRTGCFLVRTFLLIMELLPLRLSDTVVGTRNEVKTGQEKAKCGTDSSTSLLQYAAHWPRKGFLDNNFFLHYLILTFYSNSFFSWLHSHSLELAVKIL